MHADDVDPTEVVSGAVTKWDPVLTERVMGWLRPLIKGYHRSEVQGLDDFPPGGALVVGNHSGGLADHRLVVCEQPTVGPAAPKPDPGSSC